jgi:DsbC/DsbD-like thiol-disulfide interchange protein
MLVRFGRFGHPLCWLIPVLGFLPGFSSAAQDLPSGKTAHVKMVAAAEPEQGIYRVAAEIELSPSAITYWRQPGEAGVPPRFSFTGSENVASAEVLYPAPARLDEDGIEAFGYRAGVVFPILVRPQDAVKSSLLKLTLDYAVCETICIPVRSVTEITLPQRSTNAAADGLIKAAQARVPMLLSAAEAESKLAISQQTGTAKPTWTLSWKGSASLDDLFVEPPEGWFFQTHKLGANEFSLVAVEAPAGSSPNPIDLRVTATGHPKSYELTVKLDPEAVKLR